uniref:hypothetical protein n=1 Tax=Hylemonella sp. TaxID=2066020 RepID=UPI0035B11CA5
MRRMQWFVTWVIPRLRGVMRSREDRPQRVLIIYDTSTQPFSVGDILVCQEASLVLCERYGVDVVDFAILYDPKKPVVERGTFAAAVTSENVMYHIASLLPLAQVNQRLGSFFVFNSRDQIVRWMADSANQYHVWPSGWQMGARIYLTSVVFNDLLVEHYRQHGRIPNLSCRPHLREWAAGFYREQVGAKMAVTINLRNNPGWDVCRNSDIESWVTLFRYCESRYLVSFIIICAKSEIDARLRECGNVILAKDHFTSVEQDMALIDMSAMHMGAGSGPSTMAFWGNKPYLIIDNGYNTESDFYQRPDMIERIDDRMRRFWFAGAHQRIALGLESGDLLIREFQELIRGVDAAAWASSIEQGSVGAGALNSWLR